MSYKPKLIVFDLDYTLWPFLVEAHVNPPFKKDCMGYVYDSRNYEITLYPDSLPVLEHLKSEQYNIAIASRSSALREAETLLHIFNLDSYFSMKEIYPGSKKAHFSQFHRKTKIPYNDMLFFDDEERNICEISAIGVTCQFVQNGMSWKDLTEGLKKHKKKLEKR